MGSLLRCSTSGLLQQAMPGCRPLERIESSDAGLVAVATFGSVPLEIVVEILHMIQDTREVKSH